MPNTKYTKGRRAEWKVRDELLKDGWDVVIRAAGSKGPADLVGLSVATGAYIPVQVKTGPTKPRYPDPEDNVLGERLRLVWVHRGVMTWL